MTPLRFQPIFRRYLWGGRRLASELGKDIGDETCAESWEVVDREDANSVVVAGEFAGQSLQQLLQNHGEAILGDRLLNQVSDPSLPEKLRGRFPLLLKFLDANKTLSVQVHPDDEAGLKQSVPDLGKTEAWFVMDANPGSMIYCGLKKGVDRDALANAIESKTTDQVLHTLQPQPGDCIFVPAGTIHAIGEGLLVAEIQQCSDTTYRLFDWNRVGKDGMHRDLHVEQALEVTNFARGPVEVQTINPTNGNRCGELIACDKFVVRKWRLDDDQVSIALDGSFRLLMVTDGGLSVEGDPASRPLTKGQTMLLPAEMNSASMTAKSGCEFLEILVP